MVTTKPDWAVTIQKGIARTECVFRQGQAQAMAGFSSLANPYNHDASLAPIWQRGFEQENTRLIVLFAKWRQDDRGSR